MEYLKVKGYSNLIRDPKTNSIINTSMSEYQEYISRRDVKKNEEQKIQYIEDDLAMMKSDLDEIKTLLRSLLNGSK
jgi:type IV secretory pathway VirB9-like protein